MGEAAAAFRSAASRHRLASPMTCRHPLIKRRTRRARPRMSPYRAVSPAAPPAGNRALAAAVAREGVPRARAKCIPAAFADTRTHTGQVREYHQRRSSWLFSFERSGGGARGRARVAVDSRRLPRPRPAAPGHGTSSVPNERQPWSSSSPARRHDGSSAARRIGTRRSGASQAEWPAVLPVERQASAIEQRPDRDERGAHTTDRLLPGESV